MEPRPDGFDHNVYWKRSVFRAVSAKLIAEAVRPKLADGAFMAGLLSQVGQLILAYWLPTEYNDAERAAGGEWPSLQLQRETLGFTTDELGVALLNTWGLPDVIYQGVLASQNPDAIEEGSTHSRDIGRILNVATHCETLLACGLMAEHFDPDQFVGTEISEALMDLYESAYKYFGLDEAKVEQVLSGLDRRTEEIAEVLHVNLGERIDSTRVLRDAQQQVLRETVILLRDAIVNERPTEQLKFLKLADAVKQANRPT